MITGTEWIATRFTPTLAALREGSWTDQARRAVLVRLDAQVDVLLLTGVLTAAQGTDAQRALANAGLAKPR